MENTSAYRAEQLKHFSIWYAEYHGYVSLVVCFVGAICNIFNILVLTRRNMTSTTNCILTALAVSDLLTMLSYIPFALHFYCLHGIKPSPERNSLEWIWFFLFHVNFTVTTHTTSIWLGVLLAVLRYTYLSISKDGAINYNSMRHTRIAIAMVFVFSVLILIPNYLSLTFVDLADRETNGSIYEISTIDNRNYYGQAMTTANFWIHAIIIKLLPCFLMSVFGILLISTVRTTHKNGQKFRKASTRKDVIRYRSREHGRTTAMLVVVIVLFLITELPQGILAFCSGLLPGFFEVYYVPLGDVMDIVALINNGINFILYCSMSKQFRDTFLQLLCPCFLSPEKRHMSGVNPVSKVTRKSAGEKIDW